MFFVSVLHFMDTIELNNRGQEDRVFDPSYFTNKEVDMVNVLLVIGIVLLVLWLLGFITSFSLGGYIHIVLVIAVIMLVVWAVGSLMRRR